MKNIRITVFLLLSYSTAWSQTNTFPSSGNVGIGTTSPSMKLDIVGSGTSTTIARINSGGHANFRQSRGSSAYDGGYLFYTGSALDWRLQESANGSDLHFRDESLGTNVMTFQDNTGNVGIGTTNLASKFSLHAGGSVSNYMRVTNTSTGDGSGNGTLYGIDPSNNAAMWNYENTEMYFGTSNQRRMTINSDGNIGIGTTNLASKFSLHAGGSVSNYMRVTNTSTGDGSGNGTLYGIDPSNNAAMWNYENTEMYFGTSNQRRMTINSDGNIGIGTTNLASKFSLHAGGSVSNYMRVTNTSTGDGSGNGTLYGIDPSNNAAMWNYENTEMYFGTSNQRRMTINPGGSIGIGTITTGTHKLAVEGTIGAREIKVEATGWSDFVFEDNYELRTLEEVEEHINENGHLPEIPSEAEVTENGINLGEMNAKLLQKIEELTLYLIEQHKEIKKLKEKVNRLENE